MAAKTEKGLKQEIVNLFPVRLRQILEALPLDFARLEEIRMRCGQPILFRIAGKEMGITGSGDLTELGSSGKLDNWEKLEKIREKELKDTLEIMGGFSLYAAEEELRQGFFTVRGGHRIGVAGRVILKDRQITGLKAASFLNVRVAHEIKGCADQVLPFLYVNGKFVSTLIVSPPGCGKTTLLRDLIRQVSDGSSQKAGKCSFAGVNVGVADERSELGACYQGVPQNDLGMRTDVLDGCPKSDPPAGRGPCPARAGWPGSSAPADIRTRPARCAANCPRSARPRPESHRWPGPDRRCQKNPYRQRAEAPAKAPAAWGKGPALHPPARAGVFAPATDAGRAPATSPAGRHSL